MVGLVDIFFLSAPFINLKLTSKYILLMPSWMPMEINEHNFWYVFAFQAPPFIVASGQAATSNLMFMGFTNELCLQFDFLASRIRNLESEICDGELDSKLQELVEHHVQIYK